MAADTHKTGNSIYILNADVPVSEIVEHCPRAVTLLAEYGLHCVSCIFNQFDTLESGAKLHGMSQNEIEEMIEEINGQLVLEARESER